jgi:hypothetical protein
MLVSNSWTTPISGWVTHSTSDWDSTTVTFNNLPVGAKTPAQTIWTSTSDTDHWSYSITDGSGYTWTGEKDCGFESEDNNGTVNCNFQASGPTFHVIMPQSSSCSQTLSGYVGLMQVYNQMGFPITGWVKHYTSDYGSSVVTFANLADGTYSGTQGIATGPSNVDHWSYCFTGNGSTYTNEKDCGFESEDQAQTLTLEFSTTGSSSTFLVIPPVTSECSQSMSAQTGGCGNP